MVDGLLPVQSKCNMISTLARIAPSVIVPMVKDFILDILSNPEFKKVTPTEVNIMKWPEGDLYDKSVLDK